MSVFSCILIGDESLTQGCGAQLLEAGHSVRAVVTGDARVEAWAKGEGLPVLRAPESLHGLAGEERFDWILSIANLRILKPDVLRLASRGAVNFHDGPLPGYAGLNTPVWALLNGEVRHGITWHMIEAGIDTGAVLVSREFEITGTETAHSLNTRNYAAGMESFEEVMAALAEGRAPRPQGDGARTCYGAADRPRAAGLLDLSQPGEALERNVRALDFSGYWNPLCAAKLDLGGTISLVETATFTQGPEAARPGRVAEVGRDALGVAVPGGALKLTGLRGAYGAPLDVAAYVAVGDVLPVPSAGRVEEIDAGLRRLARADGFWRARLRDMVPLRLPLATRAGASPDWDVIELGRDHGLNPARVEVAVVLWAAMSSGQVEASLAYRGAAQVAAHAGLDGLVAPWVPLRLGADADDLGAFEAALDSERALVERRAGFAADLMARDADLTGRAWPQLALSAQDAPLEGTAVTVHGDGDRLRLHVDRTRLAAAATGLLVRRLETILTRMAQAEAGTPLREIMALPGDERDDLLTGWNATRAEYDATQTVHAAFEAMAAKTPEAEAVVFEDLRLSYAQVNAAANRVAAGLQAAGVARGTNVALCVARGPELIIGALGILKAGGAYVPLDPSYPAGRLAHVIEDSGAPVILTQSGVADMLPAHTARTVMMDDLAGDAPAADVDGGAGPEDLAYMIYTSGSTGKPKGVMVEHRNVANFFCGMDAHVDREKGRVWMAVTSLAFDISVLELFYTLARGFTVVISGDETRAAISNGPVRAAPGGKMDFSLYYWGADDVPGPGKYDLLLEGARYADENGFAAIWTPERHFHAFGGPYPNPSVTGASVAGFTRNIGVRAGSIVAPLHHPARIAEEWAVIDNLTNGRAGLAFASGWQPDDFVLRPENTPPRNRDALFDTLRKARALWRGETVEFARENGEMHGVVTQPRPVSPELEAWVTTAGNPETWREAGENGAHILTHLLGQSIEEVAGKIEIYHAALREAGHDPAAFKVTLMLHSYLDETREAARDVARGPMKDYLRSAAGLIKQYAWAFPAFKKPEGVTNPFQIDLSALDEDEMEAILDFAFERYFEDSGFFGTVEDAVARAESLRAIGVTEVACLIEYGIDKDTVLASLPRIRAAMERVNSGIGPAEDDFSLAAQIVRHGVTHLQATPSMARLFAMNDEARGALAGVKQMFLGGEALPGSLVADLRGATSAQILNMYGPTETTIWSSVAEPGAPADGAEPIGRPVANTVLRVLTGAGDLAPVGVPGELWIGGDGVTRGYWQRDDLTGDRFRPDPFAAGGRMYRTGDLVAWRADGQLDFLGRTDFQVKIRGQRIEPGEIETAMKRLDAVTEAVVLPREVAGDTRLVGYYTGTAMDEAALRARLADSLTGAMIPAHVVHLQTFPLTPNKKIDRKALPDPARVAAAAETAVEIPQVTPGTGLDAQALHEVIAGVWRSVLGVAQVSARDNFFDLGGHSLLAVQAHRNIRAALDGVRLTITDVFRFPVLGDLVAHLAKSGAKPAATPRPGAPDAAAPVADVVEPARRELPANTIDLIARRRAMRAGRRETGT